MAMLVNKSKKGLIIGFEALISYYKDSTLISFIGKKTVWFDNGIGKSVAFPAFFVVWYSVIAYQTSIETNSIQSKTPLKIKSSHDDIPDTSGSSIPPQFLPEPMIHKHPQTNTSPVPFRICSLCCESSD